MADNKTGFIDLFGPVRAKTENGIVVYPESVAVELDENGNPIKNLAQAIADGSLGGGGGSNVENALEVIDIEELPSPTIDTSTVVPSSGYIEKVYFNTKLSVEEIYKIFDSLTYGEIPGTNYYPLAPVISNADMSSGLVIMKVTDDLGYDYLLNTMINGENTRILNLSKEKAEWFMNETTIEYESVAEILAPQIGLEVQNDKLKQLISITPFEAPNTDIQLDKLYRTPIKEGGEWIGTAVPSSGQVGKVYFNTKLSINEVNEILKSLEYVEGVLSLPAVAVATTVDMSQGIVILGRPDIPDSNLFYMMTGDGKYIYATGEGWGISEYDLNIDNMLEIVASQVGMTIQNDKLSKLVSTTPFTKINEELVGYKYNQLVNGKWKDLGSGEDTPIIITISGLSLNEDDTDYTQIEPFITDKLWETITTNNNVFLKLIHDWASMAQITTYLQKKVMISNSTTGEVAQVSFSIPSSNQSLVIYKSSGDGYTVEVQGSNPLTNFEITEDATKIDFNAWRGVGNHPEFVQSISKTNSGDIIIPNNTNLVTAKAVYEFVTNYMSANYGNGDEEEF